MDPAGRPRFFVRAVVGLASRPCFRFIGMSVVSLAVSLGGAEGLAIGGAVSMGADVAFGFSRLSLW